MVESVLWRVKDHYDKYKMPHKPHYHGSKRLYYEKIELWTDGF